MTSTFKILTKEAGLTAATSIGFSAQDISQRPDAQTVSKSVIATTGQVTADIIETATVTSINAARSSGMSWSNAISTGVKNGLTKPIQVLKAAKAAADSVKAAKAAQAAVQASVKISEKIGATASEKAAAKLAEKVAQKLAEKAAEKAATQASALGMKAAGFASSGPIGWAILVVQLSFMVLDILWNPFQTYYNKDLAEMKESLDASIRKQFLENGGDYPLEIKPSVIPSTEEEIAEYNKFKKEYYDNNGLISSEDVFKEEEIYKEIGLLKRSMEIGLNPLYSNINLYSGTTQNIALLIATAAAKKRGYGKKLSKAIDLKKYQPSKPSDKYLTWVKFNWQLLVSVSLILVIICSLIVLFIV